MVERYQLGLSLSGAVSAGAYSAGVVDFLLQALDAWEKAGDSPHMPAHAIGLKVMSGASAGAITAAIAALSLAGDPGSEAFPPGDVKDGEQPLRYRFRRLYETWVVRPALVAEGERTDMLSLEDLAGQDVLSVLNSNLLQDIADSALRFEGSPQPPRCYVSSRLHIYITLSNLRGIPYQVAFTGGVYGMMQHGDRAHFVLQGFGAWQTESAFADADAAAPPLQANGLFDAAEKENWANFGETALASAAFPVGLAPRIIKTTIDAYTKRGWPLDNWSNFSAVTPQFAELWTAGHKDGFSYTAVDGGVIDNDPFEYALYSLQDPSAKEKTGLSEADRGVIMIAPFPEPPSFPPDGMPERSLVGAYMALLPALQQQVRFKPQTLALAGDDQIGSRYMISPSRQITLRDRDGQMTEIDARYPIASGLLHGFGGFVARNFREHDFQLGRRNCQRFLQTVFRLPAENRILQASFAGVDTQNFLRTDSKGLPLIPLVGDAAAMVPIPEWPRITEADLQIVLRRLRARLTAVAKKLLFGRTGMPLLNLLYPLAWMLIRKPGARTMRRMFLADLVRRDQIVEWQLPDDFQPAGLDAEQAVTFLCNTRAVIGALLDPAFDLRSEAGLARTCDVTAEDLDVILRLCAAAEGKPFQVWRPAWTDSSNSRLVCLMSDRPGWIKRKLGLRHAGTLFFAARTDKIRPPDASL